MKPAKLVMTLRRQIDVLISFKDRTLSKSFAAVEVDTVKCFVTAVLHIYAHEFFILKRYHCIILFTNVHLPTFILASHSKSTTDDNNNNTELQ